MARLLWLADALRAAGLTVHEYQGWRTRGLESFGPVRGIVCHGTAGSLTSTDEGELRVIAITGSGTASAPIAQLYLSRSGAWWVCASGTCTGVKTGTAGPLAGYSDDAVVQIEAQHASTEPWTRVQYDSYVLGVAALVAHGGWPVSNVVGHYEHQPREKTDPWFDMNRFRSDVAAVMAGDDMANIDQADWDNLRWRNYSTDVAGSDTALGGPAIGQRMWLPPFLKAMDAKLNAIAAKVELDPAELAKIEAAAEKGGKEGALAALATLSPQEIAEAISDEVAADVANLLAARLVS